MATEPETLEALKERGLESVLNLARQLGPEPEADLLRDLSQLDWGALDAQKSALALEPSPPTGSVAPPPLTPPSNRPGNEEAANAGWAAIQNGRLAIATVAGGQASRLGCSGPKGAFSIGPVAETTLFEILAGQIRRLGELANREIAWVIQTGPENHQETKHFFDRNNWFGLNPEKVYLACQGTLPALSPSGQLLLASPNRLLRSPDGHGGFYKALKNAGLFQTLKEQGADILFYCQIDNPLVRMGDPAFLGHHLLAQAKMSVKVVEKTEPGEKVGLIAVRNDQTCCLEYSDLSSDFQNQRDPDGALSYRAGNIAVHAFDLDFAQEMAEARLPLHPARKAVSALNAAGEKVETEAVKFETFVFDALPLAENVIVQMCDRDEEFAPVKNADGEDSPTSCKEALNLRARKWLSQACPDIAIPSTQAIELAPGLSISSQDLASRAEKIRINPSGLVTLCQTDG